MTLQKMIEALIASGMSQKELANAVGTTQPTIHRAAHGASMKYETGRKIETVYLNHLHKFIDSAA